MEHPWAWKPMEYSKFLGAAPKKRSQDYLPIRDKATCFFDSQKFSFGFSNCLVVDWVGLGRGLALLWKKNIEVEILHYFSNFIYGKIFLQWWILGIYKNLEIKRRNETWKVINFF